MEISDKRTKLLFAAFAASILIVLLPLNVSAQTSLENINEGPTQVSNLYKYMQHVPVTQYPWGNDPANVNAIPEVPGPASNHILWIGKSRPYEGLSGVQCIVKGVVIVAVSGQHSIYGNNDAGLYAFDQNTGQIIWSYPLLSSAILISETQILCGTTVLDPATGAFLYTAPRSISRYVPELKIGFGSGANPGLGASTLMASDLSNLTNPKTLWTSAAFEAASALTYSDGKIFFGGGLEYRYMAADAMTGTILWQIQTPQWVGNVAAAYGKLFCSGYHGIFALDQNTGQLLWEYRGKGVVGFSAPTVAYNKVYVHEANYGHYAFDANTGALVWKYRGERTAPFPAGPDSAQYRTTDNTIRPLVADGKVYFLSLDATRYGTALPPNWRSVDGTMWNPYNYTVIGQPGTSELVCVDAEFGKLVWKCGVNEIGSPGPGLPDLTLADGRLYGNQRTYTGHVGVKASRPYSEYDYDKQINYEWYPPYVYAFGKGPTQFREIAVDKSAVKLGENLTISGKIVDLSPSIDSVSSLSTYKRETGGPAPRVPVALSFIGADGTQVPFATVKTDDEGKFSYSWYPWEAGLLSIVVESAGSDSYEAPEMTYTTISVNPTILDLVPVLEGALVIAIIAAIALPIIVYVLKPKQKVSKS